MEKTKQYFKMLCSLVVAALLSMCHPVSGQGAALDSVTINVSVRVPVIHDTLFVEKIVFVHDTVYKCPETNDSLLAIIYVDGLNSWLGNAAIENQNLSYLKRNGFKGIALYDLGLILGVSSARDNQLAAFIKKARLSYGMTIVEAVGGSGSSFTGQRKAFNLSRTDPNERFNVFNLEWEAWRQSDFYAAMITDSTYLVQMGTASDQLGIPSGQYWGWLKFTPFLTRMPKVLMANTDYLLHHYYQKSPDAAYHKQENDTMNAVAKRKSINWNDRPIFSAEPAFSQDTLKKITHQQLYLNWRKTFDANHYTNLKADNRYYIFDLSFLKVSVPDTQASPSLRTVPFKNITTPEHLIMSEQ